MKFILLQIALFATALIPTFSFSQCPSTATLNTAYNQNNGQRGCMFTITATNLVTITCFDASLYAGTTAAYEIYYKTGTFVGFESNAAAWTLIGSAPNVTSAGTNVPTYLPIPVNVTIPSGQTVAFYVTNTAGGGLNYTDGVANNSMLASDANITVNGGVGKSYPFGLNFNYRNFNGTIHYTLGTPLPVSLHSFYATPISNTVRLNWLTNTEENSDYFEVKRSVDGLEWLPIGVVSAAGNSSEKISYEFFDDKPNMGKNYYKLIQFDINGDTKEYPIRVIDLSQIELSSNKVYPNPSSELLMISGSKDDFSQITITDFSGKNVDSLIPIEYNSYGIKCDISKLEPGLYIISIAGETIKFIRV